MTVKFLSINILDTSYLGLHNEILPSKNPNQNTLKRVSQSCSQDES